MKSRFVLACLFAAASAATMAETLKSKLFVGSDRVGSNVFDRQADGSFASLTDLQIGTLKVHSKLSGRLVEGRLIAYDVDQTVGVNHGEVHFANGRVSAIVAGKKQEKAIDASATAFYSDYHPQLCATIAAALAKSKDGVVKVFVPEAGVTLPLKPIKIADATITVGGNAVSYTRLKLPIGQIEIEMNVDSTGRLLAEYVASQKFKVVLEGFEKLYVDPIAKFPELSQATLETAVTHGIKVAMRDGVHLVHDMAMPVIPGKYPTILARTPYGRASLVADAQFWAKRGYVYISQDCRGRDESEGAWDPFVNEGKDGADTIDWIAKQPWSDGKVGMIGGSYAGYVQWAAAVERPDALKCIVPQVSPPDAMMNLPYDHGQFQLMTNLWWANLVKNKKTDLTLAIQPMAHPEALDTLPLSKVPERVLGAKIPFWNSWLERDGYPKWRGFDQVHKLAAVSIPALHISGWWDGDGIGTKLNWAAMRKAGRTNQWLIYGPWQHAFDSTSKFADEDYGEGSLLELDSLYVRWFDTWLKGKDVGLQRVPKVRVFVTGLNEWRNLSDWPEASAPMKTYFLQGSGRLVTGRLPGTLSDQPSSSDVASEYTYDPKTVKMPKGITGALTNQATLTVQVDGSRSCLGFQSAPLAQPTIVAGPIKANIYFRTDVKDTDFVALLLDVDPQGHMRVFGQPGRITAKYLAGYNRPKLLTPGKIYHATIDLWDTAHQIKAGHRLGLLILSHLFPQAARNLNTGEPIENATRMVAAHQVILHDAKHPSSVSFRVLH